MEGASEGSKHRSYSKFSLCQSVAQLALPSITYPTNRWKAILTILLSQFWTLFHVTFMSMIDKSSGCWFRGSTPESRSSFRIRQLRLLPPSPARVLCSMSGFRMTHGGRRYDNPSR